MPRIPLVRSKIRQRVEVRRQVRVYVDARTILTLIPTSTFIMFVLDYMDIHCLLPWKFYEQTGAQAHFVHRAPQEFGQEMCFFVWQLVAFPTRLLPLKDTAIAG